MLKRYIGRLLGGVIALTITAVAHGQPLNERVLVVYNSNVPESLDVATHYRTARSIPSANLCAIAPPSTTSLTQVQYNSSVRTPVRACLKAAGPRTILYIVLSWGTPYKFTTDSRSFAIDSALADVWDEVNSTFALHPDPPVNTNPYYANAQSLGNVYPPFVSMSAYRTMGTKHIYSVWRLDAPTPALAKGLVDKAIQAETSGLSGIGCFDRNRGDITLQGDAGYIAGDWDLSRAASFTQQAGFTAIEDPNTAEFGTAPAPARCDGAVLYSGWYSYNNYPNVFTWNLGAMGFHLDSGSALDPRGGTNFTALAIQNGITMTGGAMAEPYLEGLVHPDTFYRSLFEGANAGDAMLRSLTWLKWMTLSVGDPLYRPFPGGRAPFNQPMSENGLGISPRYVLGGEPATGTVFLSAPAPAGGAVVALSGNYRGVVGYPSSVTVPAGQRMVSFPITTLLPTEDSTARIEASYSGVLRRNSLTVTPLFAGVTPMESASVTGGGTRKFRIELNGLAPAGGLPISFSSNSPAATPPTGVVVPAGQRQVLFNVATNPVSANTTATLTASDGRTSRTLAIVVLPPVAASLSIAPSTIEGPGTAVGTVTLTGPAPAGGIVVTLTSSSTSAQVPASVSVPAGSASTTFQISAARVSANTSVTITARAGNVNRSATLLITSTVSMKLSAPSVMGGAKPTLSIAVGSPAPAGGLTWNLTSSHSSVASLPSTATIPAGATSTVITVTTSTVSSTVAVELRATKDGKTVSVPLSVYPVWISSSYIPPTIKGGSTVEGELYLNAVVIGTPVTVSGATNNPQVSVPAQIQIPPGKSWVKYPIVTPVVTSNMTFTATFTGPYNMVTKVITVTP